MIVTTGGRVVCSPRASSAQVSYLLLVYQKLEQGYDPFLLQQVFRILVNCLVLVNHSPIFISVLITSRTLIAIF